MNKRKYATGDKLWYCLGPDYPVRLVVVRGNTTNDTHGGINTYFVSCMGSTIVPSEAQPALESNLYRTELEAQDAKYYMLRRKGDRLLEQLIANDEATKRQKEIVAVLCNNKHK